MENHDEKTTRPALVEISEDLPSDKSYDAEIGVTDAVEAEEVVRFASDFQFRQIVQRGGPDPALEMLTSEVMLMRPEFFVENPVSVILDPEHANPELETKMRTYSCDFSSAKDKSALLDGLSSHVMELTNSDGLTEEIRVSADELFTNAVYNAPYVNAENNGPGAPRTDEFGDSPLKATMFVGSNDNRIILGCVDNYGTLDPKHLVVRLKRVIDEGAEQAMNLGTGGAGLGTYMVFQTALSMYVGVLQHRTTVVCCSFSKDRRARVRQGLPKNLHLVLKSKA